MNKSFWFSLRMLTILTLFIGFCFVMIEQRLEARTYELKISSLKSDLETIEMEKRDYTRRIDSEMARLSALEYGENTSPISLKDVVYIDLAPSGSILKETPKSSPSPLDQAVAFLMQKLAVQ